jgi:biopolymer transport protein ExbD/biopolymer transport protein TolR
MAFGRLERTTGAPPMSDINMTPLIDVMLVLLVIFMITAPLMTTSLKLDLPKTPAGTASEGPQFIALAIDSDGKLFFGDRPIDMPSLKDQVTDAARRNPQLEVQLRADKKVPYGEVAGLIALVQEAGLTRIGFVTEAPPSAK